MPTKFEIIEGFATPEATAHYPPNLQLESIHQTIKLTFNIENKIAWGSVTTRIRANSDNGRQVVFDAIDFSIKNVRGADSYSYDGEKISLNWNTSWEKGEERDVEIEYSVEEPISGLFFSHPDDKYPDRVQYAVTDHETERARYHIPCLDHPAVRCSIDFYLTAKEKYTILANGKLIEEKLNGDGTKTAHWKQAFPCPSYLITYAIGDFVKYEDTSTDVGKGEIPVAYFTISGFKAEDLKRTFDRTPEMLEWMIKKFKCPLEWDKYYQITAPDYAGAMENISMVTWGNYALLNTEEFAKEFWWVIDSINVHEMAHSWFGDMIVIREFTHGWLKESWAVYAESCYYEDTRNENEWKYDMYNNAIRYREESDTNYARPIVNNTYDSSWDMYDRHLYPGGAWRIHMLRKFIADKVSDQCFWNAVSDYLNTYKGKVVETVDFQRILEKHSGLSLQAFFDQWLYSPAYPKLKATFSYDEKTCLCSLKLEQNQVDEKKKIGVFKFPLDLMWETDENVFEHQKFEITEKVQTLYFTSDKKPKQIRFDPDYKLLCSLEFNPGTKMLERQLETGDVIAKIHAAEELVKKGKKKDLETIAKAYKTETFWGTKIQLAKFLAESPSLYGIRLLIEILENENDPMVLELLLRNFVNVRQPFVFDAMKKFLQRSTSYPHAFGTALRVIGSMRTDEAFQFLVNYPIPDDPKHMLRSNIFRAIGSIRSQKAIDYLQEKLSYGKEPEICRGAVVDGFISSLEWASDSERKKHLEKLFDIIPGEINENFLISIARSLSSMNDPSVIKALNLIKSKLSHQEHPLIERLKKKVQKAAKPDDEVKKLKKEIDSMKKSIKELKESVEKLNQK